MLFSAIGRKPHDPYAALQLVEQIGHQPRVVSGRLDSKAIYKAKTYQDCAKILIATLLLLLELVITSGNRRHKELAIFHC